MSILHEEVIAMQESLNSLNYDKFQEVIQVIIDKEWITIIPKLNLLVHDLLILFHIRLTTRHIYSDFLVKLYKKLDEKGKFLLQYTLDTSFHYIPFDKNSVRKSRYIFINSIKNKGIDISHQINEHKKFLQENDFNSDLNLLEISSKSSSVPPEKTLEFFIYYDDIDSFLYFTSNPSFSHSEEIIIFGKKYSIIQFAAFCGSVKIFRYLMLNGEELNDAKKYAIIGGNFEIIRLIEQQSPFKDDCYKFYAAKYRHSDIFKWLIGDSPEDLNVSILPKLMKIALKVNDFTTLTLLTGMVSYSNTQFIAYAAVNSRLIMLEFLIAQGADVNELSDMKMTPLHEAAEAGAADSIRVLLAAGANPMSRNANQSTPLHTACLRSSVESVEAVLEKAPGLLNDQNRAGRTPLHLAASVNALGVCELLLKRKAKVNLTDNDGYTPLDLALEFDNEAAAEIIRRYGGISKISTNVKIVIEDDIPMKKPPTSQLNEADEKERKGTCNIA